VRPTPALARIPAPPALPILESIVLPSAIVSSLSPTSVSEPLIASTRLASPPLIVTSEPSLLRSPSMARSPVRSSWPRVSVKVWPSRAPANRMVSDAAVAFACCTASRKDRTPSPSFTTSTAVVTVKTAMAFRLPSPALCQARLLRVVSPPAAVRKDGRSANGELAGDVGRPQRPAVAHGREREQLFLEVACDRPHAGAP